MKVSKDTVKKFLGENGLVMLKFGAPWCSPCKAMKPVIDQVAAELAPKGLVVGEVDIQDDPDVAVDHKVQSVPTYILFRDGQEVGRKTGTEKAQWMKIWVHSTLLADAA